MATTTHAARRDGNIIVHVASGVTHIGPARTQDGDYSYLADVLQKVLPDVARHNHIRPQLWRKLAVNCVINPLTALWNCPNGELKTIRRRWRPSVQKSRRSLSGKGCIPRQTICAVMSSRLLRVQLRTSPRCCRMFGHYATRRSTTLRDIC